MRTKCFLAIMGQKLRLDMPTVIKFAVLAIGIICIDSNVAFGQKESPGSESRQLSEENDTVPRRDAASGDDFSDATLAKQWYARELIDRARNARVQAGLPYARELLNRAAQIVADACGTDSPENATCLIELGGCDAGLHNFKDAIREFEQARSIIRRNRNEFTFHNRIGVDCNLAMARRKNGDIRIAEQLYEDVLREMNRESHRDDVDYPIVLLSLANVYLDMGVPEKAFNYLHDAQDSLKRKSTDDSTVAGGINAALGRYYYLKKDYIQSNKAFQNALSNLNGPDFPFLNHYAQVVCDYSKSLADQSKHAEALAVLNARADAIEKCFGHSHPLVLEIRQRSAAIKDLQDRAKSTNGG